MQEFIIIELLPRDLIFMKKELGNGRRNKKQLTRTTTVNESKKGLGRCREDVEKTFEKMLITRFMVIVKAGLEF